ncbi:MAG: hypothetical protein WD768_00920 [Phycisphaeraceae bacterium]
MSSMILVSLALSARTDADADQRAGKSNLLQLQCELNRYVVDHDKFPDTWDDLKAQVGAERLKALLKNKRTGDDPGYEYIKPTSDALKTAKDGVPVIVELKGGKRDDTGSAVMFVGWIAENAEADPKIGYRLTDMGDIGQFGYVQGVNNFGVAVGKVEFRKPRQVSAPIYKAFIWQKGEMIDLHEKLEVFESGASAINDAGDVVGGAYRNNRGTDKVAFVYRNGRAIFIKPPGRWSYWGKDINESGQVILSTGSQSYLWEDAKGDGVGVLTKLAGDARSLNNKGWVVGSATPAPGEFIRSCLWKEGERHWLVDPKPTLDSTRGINDNGVVIGLYHTGPTLGYVRREGEALITFLGHPMAINNANHVVTFGGNLWVLGRGQIALHSMVQGQRVGLAPWDISDAGHIVGTFKGNDTHTHGFVLSMFEMKERNSQ